MVNTIMTTKAGNNTRSRYGVKALSPMAPRSITRIGVKQHIATSTVPASAAIMAFFDLLDDVLFIGKIPVVLPVIHWPN